MPSDNTVLNVGTGGDTYRSLEDGSNVKWAVGVTAYVTTLGTPDVLAIPIAVALADNMANPTTLLHGVCLMLWDGATWDRAPGTAADGLLVNLGANNDVVVTNAGTFAVQVTGDALTALQLIDDVIIAHGDATAPPKGIALLGWNSSLVTAQRLLTTGSGRLQVNIDTIGTHDIGVGTNTTLVGATANAAAPADVAGDARAVRVWALRNGSIVVNVAVGGTLITGDGTNGLDVDVTRLIPGTAATNLGKAVDTASGATDTGVADLAVRDDALSALTPIEGDYVNLRVDSVGALWTVVSGTVTVGTHAVSQSGTWTVQPGNTANTTAWLVTGTGGTFPVTDSGGSLTVDNGGTFAVQVDGAALTALQLIDNLVLAEDAAHVTADPGVQILAVRKATPANLSGTDGDYEPLQISVGRLWVSATIDAAIPTGSNVIGAVTQSGIWTVQPGNTANTTPWLASIHDGTTKATVRDLAANDALNVAIVDGSGNQITSFGGGTQFAEDAAHMTGDVGTMALGVRKATPVNLSGTDGDYEPFQVNAGRLWVDASGVTLTVGTHAVTQSGTWDVGSITTAITPGTAAANLGKAEDAAHTTGDVGVMALGVRKDTGATIAGTDGDYAPFQLDASGNLRVNIAAGGGSGGTSATDEAAYTPASSAGTPIMGAVDETAPDTAAEGVLALIRSTTFRALHVNLRDASGAEVAVGGGTQYDEDTGSAAAEKVTMAGVVRQDSPTSLVGTDGDRTELIVASSGRLWTTTVIDSALPAGTNAIGKLAANSGVDIGDVDVTSIVSGTGATNLGKAEDAAHASADVGVMALAVRTDSPANRSGVDGDYEPLQVAGGRLWVSATIDTALPAGSNNIGDVDVLTLPALPAGTNNIGDVDVLSVIPGTGATNLGKAVDSAAGATDTGVALLAVRDDVLTTLTPIDGDYVALRVNSTGALHVTGGGGGTEYVVNAVTPADPTGATFVMERDDALSTLTEIEGDWTNPRSNANGAMWVIHDGAATVAQATAANLNATVVGTGTFAVQAAQSGTWTVQPGNTANTTAWLVTIGSGANTIAKAEDDASVNADVGVPAMAVRKATPTNTSGTDGDYEFLQMSAGRLWTSATIDAAIPAGTNNIGDVDILSLPALPAGTNNIGDVDVLTLPALPAGTNNIGDVDVLSVVPGTGATNLGKAEDTASADADVGVGMLAVRKATPANTSGADGDYEFLQMSAGRLWVDASGVTLTVASHAVTNAGTFAVQVDGSALTALQLIDDPVFTDDAAFTIATSKVMMVGATVDETSTDSADEGDAVAVRATADRKLIVTMRPNAAGEGLDIFRSLDLDETEEDVKTTAGKVYGWYFFNAASSTRYIKFYNATAATVVVGTTTPVMTIPVPAGSAANVEFAHGIPFSTAICVAATTGIADADTGAPAANDVVVQILYK